MVIEIKTDEGIFTIGLRHDGQSATETAQYFFRLMLSAGYQRESCIEAFDAVVQEYEWTREDNNASEL